MTNNRTPTTNPAAPRARDVFATNHAWLHASLPAAQITLAVAESMRYTIIPPRANANATIAAPKTTPPAKNQNLLEPVDNFAVSVTSFVWVAPFLTTLIFNLWLIFAGSYFVARNLVKRKPPDKLTLAILFVGVVGIILEDHTDFPSPLNFELIGMSSLTFLISYYAWVRGFSRSSLPPKVRLVDFGYAISSALMSVGFFSLCSLSIVALRNFFLYETSGVVTPYKITTFGSLNPLGFIAGIAVLSLLSAVTAMAGTFLFVNAIGRATGRYKLRLKSPPVRHNPKGDPDRA